MKTFLLCLLLSIAGSSGVVAQTVVPLGVWSDETGESHIEIYKCGDMLCGRLVWQKEADATAEPPKADLHNPDPTKRTRPLHNLPVLQSLRYNASAERWEDGQIYDPNNGHTYSCYLTMVNKDKLEVKGYIGFSLIGRSHYWSRVR